MSTYTLPTSTQEYVKSRLDSLEYDSSDILNVLLESIGVAKRSLNPLQTVDLFFSWLCYQNTKQQSQSTSSAMADYLLNKTDKHGPIGDYFDNHTSSKGKLQNQFPEFEYQWFSNNSVYSKFVKETYPLLEQLAGRSKVLEDTLKNQNNEEKRLVWFWILTPPYPDKPGILSVLGRTTSGLTKSVKQLEEGKMGRVQLVQELYKMVRGQ